MPVTKTVRRLFAAWEDTDRVLAGLSEAEAATPVVEGSSFAWTLGHLSNSFDSWINVRFQGLAPHPLIGQSNFRIGGSGSTNDWPAIQSGTRDVRDAARDYLQSLEEEDLELVIPYDGSIVALRSTGLCLRDALDVIIAHHYFHVGEIATKRGLLGHQVGDFPRPDWSVK